MTSITGLDRIGTGVPGLDNVLDRGLIPYRLYLLEGEPGTGKTTVALQFLAEGAAAGETCMYVTLSETGEELRAGAASHGWSMAGVEVVELIPGQDNLAEQGHLTMYHPLEVELGETTVKLLEAVDRSKPSRLVLDSLSEMRLLAQSPLRYRRQVLTLKQHFAGRRCTVLLLDDRNGESADLQLRSIAHGVILLEKFAPVYGSERRRLQVSKCRGMDFKGGFHDFAIRTEGVVVFPRLIAAGHHTPFTPECIRSGVEELDRLLGGGPDRGTSTLVMGPAGSGKSTLALQYVTAAAARGDHAAVFLFDESLPTLLARTGALGIPVRRGLEAGRIEMQPIDPAELSPGEFVHRVRQAVETNHARVVVIDSLNGYLNAMPREQFLTAQVHELLTYLGRQGVTTFLVVAQHGMVGAMEAPVDASYMADTVVVLRFFEAGGRVKKAISVLKKRSGAHESTIRELILDRDGIHLSKPITEVSNILSGLPLPIHGQVQERERAG